MSTALRDELSGDPLVRDYANMTDVEVHADLHTKYRTRIKSIPSYELLAWAGGGATDTLASRYERIETGASSHASAAVRGACKTAIKTIERDGTAIDLSLADREAMVDVMVAGEVLTSAEKDELVALGTEAISRAVELGIPATLLEIIRTRREM